MNTLRTPPRLERLALRDAARAWRLAYSLTRDPDDADDAVQQAFVIAAEKLETERDDDPWPWFSSVVVNVARRVRDARRRRREVPGDDLEARLPTSDVAGSPLEAAVASELSAMLRDAIEALSPEQRDAISTAYLAGLSHVEGACALGMPVGTFSSHVSRGLDRLRERLRMSEKAVVASFAACMPPPAPDGLTARVLEQAAARSVPTRVVADGAPSSGVMAVGGMGRALVVIGAVTVLLVGIVGAAITGVFAGAAPPAHGGDPSGVDVSEERLGDGGESGVRRHVSMAAVASSSDDDPDSGGVGEPQDDDVAVDEPSAAAGVAGATGSELVVRVVDDVSGAPVARFAAHAQPASRNDEGEWVVQRTAPHEFATTVSDHANGTVRLAVSNGAVRAVVFAEGYARGAAPVVEVPDTREVTVRLVRGVELSGTIRIEGSATPSFRANVAFQMHDTPFPAATPSGSDVGPWTPFGADAYTDRDGRYVVGRLVPGRYRVRIFRPGLLTTTAEVEIPVAASHRYDAFLRVGAVVEVTVRRADGEAVANEMVRVEHTGPLEPLRPLEPLSNEARRPRPRSRTAASGWTNDAGLCRISGIVAGDYLIEAGHDGEYAAQRVRLVEGETNEVVVSESVAGIRVQGSVTRRGSPVAEHSVAIIGSDRGDGSRPSRWVRTGPDGTFQAFLPPGTWTVHFDGGWKNGVALHLSEDAPARFVECALPTSTVSGALTSDSGPGVNAHVHLYSLTTPRALLRRTPQRTTTTGPNGGYRFENLSPGAYLVVARCAGYASARVAEFTLGSDQDHRVPSHALSPGGSLRISVLGADDASLSIPGGSGVLLRHAGQDLGMWPRVDGGDLVFDGVPVGSVALSTFPGSQLAIEEVRCVVVAGEVAHVRAIGRMRPVLRLAITRAAGGIATDLRSVSVTRDGESIEWQGSERLMHYFGVVEPGPIRVEIEDADGTKTTHDAQAEGDGLVRITLE